MPHGDLDEIAWYVRNGGGKGHDVGQKIPNALGLYDMIGNAFEWTSDKMLRGGSWKHSVPGTACTAGYAQPAIDLEKPGKGVGFRVVHEVP